jgi:2-C-methyl-D-erythritol 4-phosphate cytidylyltransferase
VTTDLGAIVPLPAAVADNAFAPVAGETSLARVVRSMLPSGVVVACAGTLADDVRESLAADGLSTVAIAVADGIGTRGDCLAAGLEYLGNEAISSRYVLVHDVRRPLAPGGVRDRVIDGLRGGSSIVVPAQRLTDSVKAVDASGSVTETLDRSMLRVVQYPRGFTADQLSRLLTRRTSDEFDELDEALRAGLPITVVDGDPCAFVADLPRDTAFVEAIITCRPAGPYGSRGSARRVRRRRRR